MTWLWAAALALAVIVLGARAVQARGVYPHDPYFDDYEGDEL